MSGIYRRIDGQDDQDLQTQTGTFRLFLLDYFLTILYYCSFTGYSGGCGHP
jgi:hypothetical protein